MFALLRAYGDEWAERAERERDEHRDGRESLRRQVDTMLEVNAWQEAELVRLRAVRDAAKEYYLVTIQTGPDMGEMVRRGHVAWAALRAALVAAEGETPR